MRKLFLLMLLIACTPIRASTGDLWLPVVAMMCLYQDPGYRNTPFGSMIARAPRFENMNSPENRALSKCFQSAEWVSKPLCTTVMNATEEDLKKPQVLYDRHAREIRTLETPGNYLASREGKVCPSYTDWLAEKKAAVENEFKRNRACGAIPAAAFTSIAGVELVAAEPAQTDDRWFDCDYRTAKGQVRVHLALNPRLPPDQPVTCESKAAEGAMQAGINCRALKNYWYVFVGAREGALTLPQIEGLTTYIFEKAVLPREAADVFK